MKRLNIYSLRWRRWRLTFRTLSAVNLKSRTCSFGPWAALCCFVCNVTFSFGSTQVNGWAGIGRDGRLGNQPSLDHQPRVGERIHLSLPPVFCCALFTVVGRERAAAGSLPPWTAMMSATSNGGTRRASKSPSLFKPYVGALSWESPVIGSNRCWLVQRSRARTGSRRLRSACLNQRMAPEGIGQLR